MVLNYSNVPCTTAGFTPGYTASISHSTPNCALVERHRLVLRLSSLVD